MSYCAIIPFKNGMPTAQIEFRNAWGGAARIWNSLFDKYLLDPNIRYHTWLCGDQSKLWALSKDDSLSLMERAVHASTFDLAFIRQSNFQRIAEDFLAFDAMLPSKSGSVNHLPSWAANISGLNADAIGFYGTSVAQNSWYKYDELLDESYVVSLSDGFEVYEWLDTLTNPPTA